MKATPVMSRRYLITLTLLWAAGIIGAVVYTHQQGIPAGPAAWAALAVLVELSFYLTLAFEEMRVKWGVGALVALAPAPYLLYSTPAGVFNVTSMTVIWIGAAVVCGWFRWFGRRRATDLLFLLLMAAPLLFKGFALVYARPLPELRLEFLGQLLWIRLGVLAVVEQRPERGLHFGFWPTLREWRTGLIYGLAGAAAALPAAWAIGFLRVAEWKGLAVTLGVAAGTFLGILWVVALSEEFFFRGLLQQWLEQMTGRAAVAVGLTSIVFGAAHLGFRGFPNWQFALLAAAMGVVYGLAFRAGGGLRPAMVAHALVVTVWRVGFA